MDIETLRHEEHPITTCPAFVVGYDDLPHVCGEPLVILQTTELVGDDYGSWTNHYLSFACGHELRDMERSLRNAEYL